MDLSNFKLPITTGQIFFVDSGKGSDVENGLTPKTAFRTIQKAVDMCSGQTHDYIMLLPSATAYSGDATAAATTDDGFIKRLANCAIYINKPYVHIICVQNKWGDAIRLAPAAACTAGFINIGASGDYFSLENAMLKVTANAILVLAAGAGNVTIKDCYFKGGTIGIDADAGSVENLNIEGCKFEDQTTYGVAMDNTKGSIVNCYFTTPGATAPTALLYLTGTAPSIVGPGIYCNGLASAAAGILNNNVAGVMFVDCHIYNCTDNIAIGSGGNAAAVSCFSNAGGQGATNVATDLTHLGA